MSLDDGARGRVDSLRAIDSACDRHEAAWRSGGRPSLNERLAEVDPRDHGALLRELIPLDAHYRQAAGETPRREDYAHLPGIDDAWLARTLEGLQSSARPRMIGRFELLERLGAGGFGAVWKARDSGLDRLVALKILHPGHDASPEDSARFLREARAAGGLRHPGIATVFEVATADGLPALVTELVEGHSLRDVLKSRSFSPHEAARLVADLADAVAYAHSLGVIHRDLKPANVLLDEARGHPVLVDFGLARRAGSDAALTRDGQLLGTPAYMSPEQAQGLASQAGERSDVYGLGLILYEAACGKPAFSGEPVQVLEQVRAGALPPPRKARRDLPRDLETIILKAVALSPEDRYASARALADDLRRFLEGEAVHARRDSIAYSLWRGMRRHRAALVIALAFVALLAAFAVTASVLALQARRDAATAREVEAFLTGLFDVADPDASRGEQPTVRELVDRGAARIGKELAGQPVVQGRLLRTLGGVQAALDERSAARDLLERSLATLEGALPADDPEIASTALSLAAVAMNDGDLVRAEGLARRALAIRERDPRTPPADLAAALHRMGEVMQRRRQHGQAFDFFSRALAVREAARGPSDVSLADDLEAMAEATASQGDIAGGLALQLRALGLVEQATAPDDPRVAKALSGMAQGLSLTGRHDEALAACDDALGLTLRIHGERSSRVAELLQRRAAILSVLRRRDEAAVDLQRALSIRERIEGPDTLAFADSANRIGVAMARAGCTEDASLLYERTLRIKERLLPPGSPELREALYNLASRWADDGRADEAERLYGRALDAASRAVPPDPVGTALSLIGLAKLDAGRDRVPEALATLQRFEAAWGSGDHPVNPATASIEHDAGEQYRRLGRAADALRHFQRAVQMRRMVDGPMGGFLAQSYNGLGGAWSGTGCFDEAAESYRSSLEINLTRQGPAGPDVRSVSLNLALVLVQAGRGAEALEVLGRLENGDMRNPANDGLRIAAMKAAALAAAGRTDEALDLAEGTASAAEAATPADRRQLIQRMRALALARAGHADDGAAIAEGVVAELNAEHGPDDARLAPPLRTLAECERLAGRVANAEALLARAAALSGTVACP